MSHILFSGFSGRRDIVATTGAVAVVADVADVHVVSGDGAVALAGLTAADVESLPFVDASDTACMRLRLGLDGPRIIKV